jgi:AraC-like DNA-binding protein
VGAIPDSTADRAWVNLACRYLSEGRGVKEVADKIGFNDPSYFSRLLKKITGTAPSRYHKP